jgi:glutamate/aspartate transport system substrate-binding protein
MTAPALSTWLRTTTLVVALLWGGAGGSVAQESPVMHKLRTTGVISLGYRASSPPFSYVDAQLQPIGFTVALCMKVVDALRKLPGLSTLEVRPVPVTSATRLPLVANGTVDLECGITTNNAERQRQVNFSSTIFVAESRVLSKRGAVYSSLDELRGQPVVSTIGTTSIQYLQTQNRQRGLGLKILGGVDDVESFRIVDSGRAVAFAMDDVILHSLLATAANAGQYVVSPQSLSVEPYGIGLNRHDPGFKRLVDEVLVGLFRSGEFNALYQRWFESPIPPHGLNLKLPMSAALKRLTQQPSDSPDPARYR